MLASRGAGGGQTPVGGDYTRGLSGLFGSRSAIALRRHELDPHAKCAASAEQSSFQSANVLIGNAAALSSPIATFGSGASNALNQYVQQRILASEHRSCADSVERWALGLGTGLSTFGMGGLSKVGGMFSPKPTQTSGYGYGGDIYG